MIEGIRAVGADLELDALVYGKGLACREIDNGQARTHEAVSAHVAKGAIGGKCEGSRVVPVLNGAVLRQGIADYVRIPVSGLGEGVIGAADVGRIRIARVKDHGGGDLPSTDDRIKQAAVIQERLAFADRQLVDDVAL